MDSFASSNACVASGVQLMEDCFGPALSAVRGPMMFDAFDMNRWQ